MPNADEVMNEYDELLQEEAKEFVSAIPDADRKAIVLSFKENGVDKPTDEQIMQAYRKK